MKTTLKIMGLDCVACATELEEILKKADGVKSASVSFITQKVDLEYETEQDLKKALETINGFEEVRVVYGGTEKKLRLQGLHCANCALALEDELKKIDGVEEVEVDFMTQSIRLKATSEATEKVIKKANRFEKVRVLNGDEYVLKKERKTGEIVRLVIGFVFLVSGLLVGKADFSKNDTVSLILYLLGYVAVGYPVLISTFKNLLKGKIFDENFLMTLASVGAFFIGEYPEGVAVMLLYELGEFLQGLAVGKSRARLTELMALKSESAEKEIDGQYVSVSPEELCVGDKVLVRTGDKVSADGKLLSERCTLDTKSLTGEFEERELLCGAELLAGTVNVGTPFEMEVVRKYKDSAVQKILDVVENSEQSKAKPEKFITKFSRIYTPVVCLLALIIAFGVPAIQVAVHSGKYFDYFEKPFITALELLVISCPCALIISVPLTYFIGIGASAKSGILVKGATYLDSAKDVSVVAFDKTGTLTSGNFEILSVHPKTGTKEELVKLIASIEKFSSHPIKKAFESIPSELFIENVSEQSGKGLVGEFEKKELLVGTDAFMKENGVAVNKVESVSTVVHVALDKTCLGYVEVGDSVRSDAKETLEKLKKLGVKKTVMLTGDRKERAEKICRDLGIDECFAELLPTEKSKVAKTLKEQGRLLYVGDGINDAPVMTEADVSVSMGKLGSSVAVEASDFVLVSDRLDGIPKIIEKARSTHRTVVENIAFSVGMKAVFMVLSVLGFMALPVAVFGDVGVMLIAVLNSFKVGIKNRENK